MPVAYTRTLRLLATDIHRRRPACELDLLAWVQPRGATPADKTAAPIDQSELGRTHEGCEAALRYVGGGEYDLDIFLETMGEFEVLVTPATQPPPPPPPLPADDGDDAPAPAHAPLVYARIPITATHGPPSLGRCQLHFFDFLEASDDGHVHTVAGNVLPFGVVTAPRPSKPSAAAPPAPSRARLPTVRTPCA